METQYLRALKQALLPDSSARLAMICNFEVETQWARHHVGLPAPNLSTSAAVVQRMEELGALLAGSRDALVLKHQLDPGYLAYLDELGLPTPEVLVPEHREPGRSTTEDALASPRLLARLAELARGGAWLLPMGTSALEQKLAEACGLPLAAPDAAIFERVNSKIYGRRLVADAGLRSVPGAGCETVAELAGQLHRCRPVVAAGTPVVVKDAYGVSGKGLVVLDTAAKLDRLLRMTERRADRTGDPRLHVVVEEWLPVRYDLNYQLTVDRAGRVRLDFVKQALTRNGVHQGHLMPADLASDQLADIERAAGVVGRRLHGDGYFGVAGVDAIITTDGILYPVLEVNARLNMSTYQGGVTERFQPAGAHALARHYPLRRTEPLRFAELRRTVDLPLLPGPAGERLVITGFGTVNAGAGGPEPVEGRLYAVLVAPDRDRLTALDTAVQYALNPLSTHREV